LQGIGAVPWPVGRRRQRPAARGSYLAAVSTSLCHGLAGLLLTVLLFAVETTDADFSTAAGRLTADLAGQF
jgi:hypothetical protein